VSTASWEWTHEANKQNANKLKEYFHKQQSFLFTSTQRLPKAAPYCHLCCLHRRIDRCQACLAEYREKDEQLWWRFDQSLKT
jgi:hypothetical protein